MEGAETELEEGADKDFLKYFYSRLPKDFMYHYLQEGEILDLGGRKVEVIKLNAHADAGLGLLDLDRRLLYTGDELDPGQVLLVCQRNIESEELIKRHLHSMEKLWKREKEYDLICPAHNGVFISKKYVTDFIELDKALLNGTAERMESPAGFNWAPEAAEGTEIYYPAKRSQFGRASIVYF